MKGKEASEAALLPEEIRVPRRALLLLQLNQGGGNTALTLPFISMGKMSLKCSVPTADQGEKHTTPFASVFFYPVASPDASYPWAGEPCARGGKKCVCQEEGRAGKSCFMSIYLR